MEWQSRPRRLHDFVPSEVDDQFDRASWTGRQSRNEERTRNAQLVSNCPKRLVIDMKLIEPRVLKENEFWVSDLPHGSALLLGDVAVFNVGGTFCATQARCTHRQGPLAEGKLEGSTVTCPLHGAQFNVCSGAVLRGPAQVPLTTYRVVVEGNVGRVEGGSKPA
jgi:nitrite reductase/ring-hydroxylating ferredoxin subunit